MSDLKLFLTALGLDRYHRVFVENDVDLGIVAELTEQDLERMGLSLGHRRKFIAAAQKLGRSPASFAPSPTLQPPQQVERRQVTVLFADLVGSTALANELDPEDLSHVLTRYRSVCAAVIAQFGGHVAQFLGDGILAYFGYPRAQEQAAERAVRAALELVAQVAQLDRCGTSPLLVRVGIATGLVVGETDGLGTERSQTVVGTTPNLAARLQALAEPGSVLVAHSTRQLTGDFFEYLGAGEFAIKGFEFPVRLWRVVGERKIESRFAAARGCSAGPIVARERELAFLQDSWVRAVQGEGHVVLINGEAGMGKSRLLEALVERVEGQPHRLLRCQCSPYHLNSALYPVAQLMRREAALQADCPAPENLKRIEALLADFGRTSRRNLLLIAEFLDVPTLDRLSGMELTLAQRNAETLEILEAFLLWNQNGAPVLLLLEDAHWSDPTTQSLVERLLSRVDTRNALILVTHRPEFRKLWDESPHSTTLTCKQLGSASSVTMVRRVAGGVVDDALLQEIVKRSDGVPLYIEELTKAVLDIRAAHVGHVPETLQDSLMTRLDRLGESKEIALIASVIGRSFSYALLTSVAGLEEDVLRLALDRLLEAGIFFAVGDSSARTYSFNHSLVQEAAYESVSRSRRQTLHLRIARALDSHEDEAANAPEMVAYHFSRAQEPEQSCRLWILAAEKAGRHSSFVESIACLNAALLEAERIADPDVRARRLLDVRLRLGATFIIHDGPLSAEAESSLAKAHALATAIVAERQLFQATWGLYINSANSRQFEKARVLGGALMEISGRLGDDDLQVEGLHHRWGYWYFVGSNAKMLHYTREGLSRYDPERHHRLAQVFAGHDLGVCAHCVEAIGLALSGQVEGVSASVNAAVTLADSLQHPTSLSFAFGAGSVALQLAGDVDACGRMAEQELELVNKYDLALPRALGHFMLGLSRTEQGDMARGLAMMEANYAVTCRYSFLGVYPDVVMADALARAGRRRDSLALVTRTLDTIVSPEVGLHVSELWRMRGELALEGYEDRAEAQRFLRIAVNISEEQGASVYHAKAGAALGRALD